MGGIGQQSARAPHVSNKDGAPTIAKVDNAGLPNVLLVETKEGMTTLLVDEPDATDSGGKLAMEVDEDVLETKFPAKEHVVEPTDVE